MNRYPLWKNILVVVVILMGVLYALPNLYSQDPSIEITSSRRATVDESTVASIKAALENAGVTWKAVERTDGRILVRFEDSEAQLKGNEVIAAALEGKYKQALTLAADLPDWLRGLGAKPMYLGLDLRGGIHVLIDVDMAAAIEQALERYAGDIRSLLRKNKVRYVTVSQKDRKILVKFKDAQTRDKAQEVIYNEFRNLAVEGVGQGGDHLVQIRLTPAEQAAIKKFALGQNITTL
ncbi:MAG TPA: protein translocase subunit SecD, partial [Chromatiales bacterium]|nr:protein translocase subunit SecD [Chromatiales bacterium]